MSTSNECSKAFRRGGCGVSGSQENSGASNVVRLSILNAQERKEGGGGGGTVAPPGSGDGDAELEPVYCSDDMLASELIKALSDDWRYVPLNDSWYRWTGQRWEREELRAIWKRSGLVCRGIAQNVDSHKLARDVSSKTRIYAAVKLAGDRLPTRLDAFDRDDRLINTLRGIVDLTTGQLRDHDRAAMMSRMTSAGPTPEAQCPLFLAYLHQATGGDRDLQRFLQRIAGYCLTGGIEEQAIFFLYGPGGTGKTLFLLVLFELLGDYATKAEIDIFTVATGERHSAPIASLAGARLVITTETAEGVRWDEAKIKALTGGEPITANFMRGNPFTFHPKFKFLIAGNHRPRMRSADDAMRRRFNLIPFKHKPEKVDLHLLEKLRPEFGAILKWAVEGELERRRIGLSPPRVVVEATDEYFQSENTIGRWIDERCVTGPNETCLTDHLYRDFKIWAAKTGEFVVSQVKLALKLGQMSGIERWRDDEGKRGFRGLSLKNRPPDLFSQPTPKPRGGGGAAGVSTGPTYDPAGSEYDPGDDYPRE